MDISSTNTSYTGNDVILTTQFPAKRVTLETQASLEKLKMQEEAVVYTRSDFYRKAKAHLRVTVNENGASAHPSKAIVQNYIQNGMTALEAVNAYKAQLAYGTSSSVNGVRLLNTSRTDA